MKHLKFIIMMLVAANIALVSSCKKDDDGGDDPTKPKPTLAVAELSNSGNEFTVSPGTTLQFAWNAIKAGGGKDLDVFEISTSGANTINPVPSSAKGYDFPYDISNAEDEQYLDTITIDGPTQNLNEGITTYTFSVTDKDGQKTSVSIKVTVEVPSTQTPLATERTDAKFYHIAGTLQGAYDLANGALKSAGDPDAEKDMKNTDLAATAFTGSWEAGNSTMFVKTTSAYGAIGTVEAAELAYNSGTATSSVTNPVANDVYVAKLRGTDNYVVIQILTVDPNDNTCSCLNKGVLTFKYKGE